MAFVRLITFNLSQVMTWFIVSYIFILIPSEPLFCSVSGLLSFVWFVLWMLLVSDSPSQHKRISKLEQKYIEHTLKDSVKSGEKDRVCV